ncbi:MAG: hypothetical protein FJX20_04330 [Alphaproteobacteria bacterium]|nr:hypothetical protein [Alphaproteobacteria bacterium]
MLYDTLVGLGQPLRRLEGPRLLTGDGRYKINVSRRVRRMLAVTTAIVGALDVVFWECDR